MSRVPIHGNGERSQGEYFRVASALVLPPYTGVRRAGLLKRGVLAMALVALATFYGLMIAVLPPQLLVVPAMPIFIMTALILWMLPDTDQVYDSTMDRLMCVFVGANVLWPSYIAANLPGLPWVTPTRIAVFAMLSVVLFNLSTSSVLRARIVDSWSGVPLLRRLFWLFWGLTTVSLLLSSDPFFSLNKYANNQIFWTLMFAVTAFLATREGFAMRMSTIFVWSTFVIAVLGIYEYKIQRVFWLDHLPSFLKVDPDYLERIMASQARAGTDVYRTKSTFATSLSFAEYLAMVFPLCIHFMTRARGFWRFATILFGVMGVMVAMYLTNARSAMVGLLMTIVLYVLFAAWRGFRRNPSSVGAAATLYAYPAGVIVMALLVVFWQRAHVMVLGGGAQQASSDARKAQWEIGLHKLMSNPVGHGVGRAAEVLGYRNGEGTLTIDTYYLSLLLEYGVLGLGVFILLFALPGWFGFKAWNEAETEDELLVGPIAIGLVNFTVIKSVLSSEINMPIAFVMLGAVVGLIWRQNRKTVAGPAAEAAPPGVTAIRSAALPRAYRG